MNNKGEGGRKFNSKMFFIWTKLNVFYEAPKQTTWENLNTIINRITQKNNEWVGQRGKKEIIHVYIKVQQMYIYIYRTADTSKFTYTVCIYPYIHTYIYIITYTH